MKPTTISFLVSGRGSNFQAVAAAVRDGSVPATLGIVISDRAGAGALDIARQFGMGAFHVDAKAYPGKREYESAMIELLERHATDLVVAAGFMRILSPHFVGRYRNRIINIHPALLPSFPGAHGQEQAFAYGVKISGCTAHFIDEGVDSGPVIMQAAVPVMDDDTVDSLSARILKEEHRILPESVRLFCQGRLRVEGRKVFIKK
ncbi:MAG TPA: phosphoribosylglycinamide formyltransferase [Spirochaetota bacterium]|nr:phosphoribosylglycinamide formyltransferase [Spirochaetota bacterium]HPU86911.1 phosphoribosylglycinamide formyltransferase [Spirochaetota bacterium]